VLGIRFRQPNAITETVFEGDLFVDKRGSLGEEFIRLINRIVMPYNILVEGLTRHWQFPSESIPSAEHLLDVSHD
jgi:hypothetical protein